MSELPQRLVLFDGRCPLCDGIVQVLLRLDRHRRLSFAPLQGETAAVVRENHPELADTDSVVYLRQRDGGDELHLHSAAALHILVDVGWPWRLAGVGFLIPRPWRDAVYNWIARHRTQWFGRFTEQPVHDDERFLA